MGLKVGVAAWGTLMTVSYDEFVRQARAFVAISERLQDGWELRRIHTTDTPEETAYLAKNCTKLVDFHDPVNTSENISELETPPVDGNPENIEDEDPSALHNSCKSDVVHFEYHVVYSPSYRVPVLYFNATFPSGKLIPLQEVWQLLSPIHVRSGSGTEWGTVTQQEHPLLCCPFYHIHPCHTADVMGTNVTQNPSKLECGHRNETDSHRAQYLLSWLTIYGPTIGLNLSLNYLNTT